MKQGAGLLYALSASLAAVAACSMASGDDASLPVPGPVGSGGSSALPGGEPLPQPEPQPEQELDRAFRVPVVSGRWVWTANPSSGLVALIDAKTFAVKTTEAGAGPTYLTSLPPGEAGGSRALVINSVSRDATLLSANEEGDLESAASLPVHEGANAWAVTPDGSFAIAWTDASAVKDADPSQGFQDITVLDLRAEPFASKRLSVGYRPARVFMDDDNRHAYVATDAGLDVVALATEEGAIVERALELSANPANDTAPRDVNMTPDGTLAFVSRQDKAYVTVVNVEQGVFKDIALPGVVTDLDLSADASMAVAIIRQPTLAAAPSAAGVGTGGAAGESGASEGGGAEVEIGGGGGLDGGGGGAGGEGPGPGLEPRSLAVLLPVASVFEAPTVFDSLAIDQLVGSVELGAQGAMALLFSNGVPSTYLTLLDLSAGDSFKQHRTVDLKLPVFSAVSSPDGAHAVVLLQPAAGSAQPGAFAVVPVTNRLPPKIQGTQAATVPTAAMAQASAMVAVADQRALVTVTDGVQAHWAYVVNMPELTVNAVQLASTPLPQASGIVHDANQAFVAQQHPEGRITFIDLDTQQQHTLTGFELSTQVGR